MNNAGMIADIQRGHIRLSVRARSVTVQGEALLPGHGSPSFVANLNSIQNWDSPDQAIAITDEEKNLIVEMLKGGMAEKNMTIEFE